MKLNLTTYRNKHGWKITYCNKENIKITKSRTGSCFFEMHLKCNLCGARGKFTHWHEQAFIPDKENKKLGMERVYENNKYSFEIK